MVLVTFILLLAIHSDARDLPELTDIDCCPEAQLGLYLYLAKLSSLTYQTPEDEMIVAKHGCAALVRMDEHDNLIIAFRGSVSPFISRATIQTRYLIDLLRLRRYQDWFQTNILQSLGFLPAQYLEAANMVVQEIQKYPSAKGIFITGHSKGGGVAEAAAAVAWLEPEIPREVKERIMAVTFNAAVVHVNNWQILYERSDPVLVRKYLQGDVPRVDAVIMRDDFVPKIGWRNRRLKPFVNLFVIKPRERISAADQHSIAVVIGELEERIGIYNPSNKQPTTGRQSFIYADPVVKSSKHRQLAR